MRKKQIFTGYFYCLTSLAAITGCMDDTYDLSKDFEIQLAFDSDGVTLPTSSTGDIKLSQVMELEKDGQLKTDVEGNYLFYKSGKTKEETTISVGYGSICNTAETNYTYHLKQDPALQTTVKYPEWNINTMQFTTKVSPDYKPDKLGSHVRALDYVDTPMAIVVELLDNNISGFAPYISEIRYSVPSFYVLEDKSELVETQVRTNQLHYHAIRCKGVDFNAAQKEGEAAAYDSKTGQIIFKGEVKIECKIDFAYMDVYDATDDPHINIRVTMGSLTTDRVTGRFDKSEWVDIEPITFDDLPEMITDKEVVIDIDNPVVRLTINNEVPARALVNATLKAYKDGTESARLHIGETYGTDSIKFEGGRKQTVWISRKPTEIPDTVAGNVVVSDIMSLMKTMPDKIEIDGWAHTDSSQTVTMNLNHEYKVQPTYELVAPLIIGPDMKLVYTKETDGLRSKIKNLEISKLTLTGKVKNSIPLDLTATMTAKDEKGNEIKEIVLEQNQTIKGMGETNITLTLAGTPENFKNMDRLEIKAYAESNGEMAGHALNENQALRIEDIKVTVR